MLIATLSLIGAGAGYVQCRNGSYKLGTWAILICSAAFVINLF